MKKIPRIIQRYHPQFMWRVPTHDRVLYLTFDDGPQEGITEWVLDTLAAFDAKATFFLLGKQVKAYPTIVHHMIDSGHSIGNHGYAHIDGWKAPLRTYLLDFLRAKQAIFEYTGVQTRLFRPAYAHITQTKAQYILRSHQIIMMDVMSGDFDSSLSGEAVAQGVIQLARSGSILLFHDNLKSQDRLRVALPRVLRHFQEKGYEFRPIMDQTFGAPPTVRIRNR
ncbi:MAG: polysaccharide deacetylase family protein [Bacteroidota bacterium]